MKLGQIAFFAGLVGVSIWSVVGGRQEVRERAVNPRVVIDAGREQVELRLPEGHKVRVVVVEGPSGRYVVEL